MELDGDLIKRIAARDEAAMRALYQQHNGHVFRFVARTVRDDRVAEDITGEVFLHVWRQASAFEFRTQVSAWLLAIARRKARAANRTANRMADRGDVAPAPSGEAAGSPEQALLRLDRRATLRACIAQLPPEHRQIVDLVYCFKKTIDEVAEILQVPRNAVETRMTDARRALQRLIAGAIFKAVLIEGSRQAHSRTDS
jgi:RNA polymerase sigma-70 factor (ECF subfamily)